MRNDYAQIVMVGIPPLFALDSYRLPKITIVKLFLPDFPANKLKFSDYLVANLTIFSTEEMATVL